MTTDMPGVADVGTEGTWHLPSPSGVIPVKGHFIGMSSSQRETHKRHTVPTDSYVSKGERCSACRWSVFRVFREAEGGYAIHHTGMSVVPGETTRFRHERVRTAYQVVESMVTRRRGEAPRLSAVAAMLLAECAAHDIQVRDAYENRVVG